MRFGMFPLLLQLPAALGFLLSFFGGGLEIFSRRGGGGNTLKLAHEISFSMWKYFRNPSNVFFSFFTFTY